MGYYIEVPQAKNKAAQLVSIYKATIIPCPISFEDIPRDKALICVVNNQMFEAAGYCYSPSELQEFKRLDGRPRQWLLMDKSITQKLTGFN